MGGPRIEAALVGRRDQSWQKAGRLPYWGASKTSAAKQPKKIRKMRAKK
jgi:hypothetical protein